MANFTSIRLKHTDPDTGGITFETIAEIDQGQAQLIAIVVDQLIVNIADDPNTEVDIQLAYGEVEQPKDEELTQVFQVFQLGELAYNCLSTRKTKYGNDAELGSAIRSRYIQLNSNE